MLGAGGEARNGFLIKGKTKTKSREEGIEKSDSYGVAKRR